MTADVPETLVERFARPLAEWFCSGSFDDIEEGDLDLPRRVLQAIFGDAHDEGLIYWAEELERAGWSDPNGGLTNWGPPQNADFEETLGWHRLYRLRRDT